MAACMYAISDGLYQSAKLNQPLTLFQCYNTRDCADFYD